MYFKIVPDIAYDQKPISFPFSKSDYVVAKNFFRRYKLNDDIFSDAVYFKKYAVQEGERPEHVAKKAYGNPFYDWVVLLTNNVINAQYDWPLSGYDLSQVIETNFDDPYGTIRHYEIKEEIGRYAKGLRVDKTFYDGQHKLNIGGSIITKNGNLIYSKIKKCSVEKKVHKIAPNWYCFDEVKRLENSNFFANRILRKLAQIQTSLGRTQTKNEQMRQYPQIIAD